MNIKTMIQANSNIFFFKESLSLLFTSCIKAQICKRYFIKDNIENPIN